MIAKEHRTMIAIGIMKKGNSISLNGKEYEPIQTKITLHDIPSIDFLYFWVKGNIKRPQDWDWEILTPVTGNGSIEIGTIGS